MSRSMKEYWMRRYDTEERQHHLCRLNTQQPLYARNLKEAQSEAERLNGCAGETCAWTKHDQPTRHWRYYHRYARTKFMSVELFPSEKAMQDTPLQGEDWTNHMIPTSSESDPPETELEQTKRYIAHLEKLIPALEAEDKADLARISRADLLLSQNRLIKLQPEPQAEQLTLF